MTSRRSVVAEWPAPRHERCDRTKWPPARDGRGIRVERPRPAQLYPEGEPPEGKVEAPGKVEPPEGEVEAPEGKVEPPDGEVEAPEGEVEAPEGKVEPPEGKVEPPEGEVEAPEGEVEPPEGEVEAPEGKVEPPEGKVEPPEGEVEAPEGEVEAPEGNVEAPEGETPRPEQVEPQIKDSCPALVVTAFAAKAHLQSRAWKDTPSLHNPLPDHMNSFLTTALLAFAALAHAADRPNILFIMTDDHAAHAISAYGSKVNQTPNMDRLAKTGMRFANAFVTNSICTPSRATLLTGKYSHLNGSPVFNSFDGTQQTVAKLMQAGGYHTGMIGKWHLGSAPTGFDRWIILPGQGIYNQPDFLTPEGRLSVSGYTTDVITDLGIEFLQTRPTDKPFLLFLHHKAPHRDWTPSPKYAAEFRAKKIPEPETLRDDYATRPAALPENRQRVFEDLNRRDLKLPPPPNIPPGPKRQQAMAAPVNEVEITEADGTKKMLTGDELKAWKYQRYMQDYLACVQSVDDGVGKVLDHLEKTGLAKNTIVFYTSDNGFFLGDMGLFDKRFMYEPSLRVPLMASGPGVKPEAVSEAFALNVDFAPTFLDLAGQKIPADMQGRSLVPLLKGEPPADWRTSMYYRYYHDPGHHNTRAHLGVRTATHKLIYYWKKDAWELFDLKNDPNEQKNLYADPASKGVVDELKAEILRFKNELKDQEQFADKIPEDDVDGPRNFPKLGLKSVQEAIQSSSKTDAAVKF